jgi:hypothetical protein
MTDHEGYDVEYELYCNNCAVDLFDKTGHLDSDEQDSRKRSREPEEEQDESCDQMRDLTDESCDIWELALEINNGDKEAALRMIEDQERLRAHPRIIEYYRAKESAVEECSLECSSLDEDLQERKRARHIRFESVDLDVSDAEDEVYVDENMIIDLISQDDSECADDYDVEDGDDEDYDYDYAESVVDDDSEVESEKTVTMSQTVVSSMVTMIQELRDENEALRHELELLRGQRRMLFPNGSSINFTDEDGERYLNIHAASPYASAQVALTMADLEGDLESNSDSDFAMDVDDSI